MLPVAFTALPRLASAENEYRRCEQFDSTPQVREVGWNVGARSNPSCPPFPAFYERFIYESALLCGSDLEDSVQEALTERLTGAELRDPVRFWSILETEYPKISALPADKEAVARSFACLIAYGIRTLPAPPDARREATELVASALKKRAGTAGSLARAVPAVLTRLRTFYQKQNIPAAADGATEPDLETELKSVRAITVSSSPLESAEETGSLTPAALTDLQERLRIRRIQLLQTENVLGCYRHYLQPPLRDTLEKSYGSERELSVKRDQLNHSQCELAQLITAVSAPALTSASVAAKTGPNGESGSVREQQPERAMLAQSAREVRNALEEARINFEGAKVATTRKKELYEKALVNAERCVAVRLPSGQQSRELAAAQRVAADIAARSRNELARLDDSRAVDAPAASPSLDLLQPRLGPAGRASEVDETKLERELGVLRNEITTIRSRAMRTAGDVLSTRTIKLEISKLRGKTNRILEQADASGFRGLSIEAKSLIGEIDGIPIPGVRGMNSRIENHHDEARSRFDKAAVPAFKGERFGVNLNGTTEYDHSNSNGEPYSPPRATSPRPIAAIPDKTAPVAPFPAHRDHD